MHLMVWLNAVQLCKHCVKQKGNSVGDNEIIHNRAPY